MKQKLCVFLALAFATGCLAGCGQGGGDPVSAGSSHQSSAAQSSAPESKPPEATGTAANVNPPGEFPICKEPIDINVGIIQSVNVEDYETNKLTLWYEEKGNFNLSFDTFPSSATEAQQKLEVVVASGSELPEVLIGFNLSEESMLSYGIEGAAIPLNDYYDNWAYYINEALDALDNKNMRQWLTSADGNIYYIPKSNEQIGNMYANRSWINKTWLDNLGLEMPKTTDDFKKVLTAFVNDDPNQNGQKDEIGMIGSAAGWRAQPVDWLMNAFIYNEGLDRNRFIVGDDDKLIPAYTQPEWKEGLAYVSDLVASGLLLPQIFTMDDAQLRQMSEGGDSAAVGAITHGNFASCFGATNERKLEYVSLPPLTGPGGKSYATFYPVIPMKNFIITKDAKNPEAIFRWGDLMCSEEGYMRTRWGEPGVDWLEPGPNEKSLLDSIGIKAKMVPILQWGSVNNSHWSFPTAGMLPMGVADGQVAPPDDPLYGEIWVCLAVPDYMGKAPEKRADNFKFTLEEAEEIKDLKTSINTYVKESIALFAVGDRDIEKDWDSYLKELDSMGLSRYMEISQSGYERAK